MRKGTVSKSVESLTIGELRKLVEPLCGMHQRDAMSVIASHGNSIGKLADAIGWEQAKFIYGRLKELLSK